LTDLAKQFLRWHDTMCNEVRQEIADIVPAVLVSVLIEVAELC
jgi:hypothetical protein